ALFVPIKLRSGGRHDEEPPPARSFRQARDDLLVELRPVAARDHRHLGDIEQILEQARHLIVDRLLAFGERAVEIERDQLLHAPRTIGSRISSIARATPSCSFDAVTRRAALRTSSGPCPIAIEKPARANIAISLR